MKRNEYLQYGKKGETTIKRILRCVEEKDLGIILKRLNVEKKDYKIKYEGFSKKNKEQNFIRWGGLPDLIINPPHPELILKFVDQDDVLDFYEKILQKPYVYERGYWFPEKKPDYPLKSYWTSSIEKINKYPLFVISKGRYKKELSKTINWLNKSKILHYCVVEECEFNEYSKRNTIDDLPYTVFIKMDKELNNLGKGSIPVRNWIDDFVKTPSSQFTNKMFKTYPEIIEKYWVIDDNINGWFRFHKNTRREIRSAVPFRICEDFSDKCKNLYMSGMQYFSFLPEISRRRGLCIKNTRIYSCILMDTKLKDILDGELWRGRYNEDTDLSLRLLKKGFPTVLHQQFLCNKSTTMSVKGGNTDSIYQNDGLQKKLDSLIQQHPDVVKGTIKFKKVHHQVDYKSFKKNEIIYKWAIDTTVKDDWGLGINL